MAHPAGVARTARRRANLRKASLAAARIRGRGFADTGQPGGTTELSRLRLQAERGLQTQIPIRAAVITTPGRAIAVRALARVIGSPRAGQVGAIARQQFARIPLAGKVVAGGVGITAITEATTGMSPIALGRSVLLRQAQQQIGARQAPPRRQQMTRGGALAHPSQHVVVRTWQTFPGGPIFARFSDGHIEVQRKDGTIKTFRPYRPVVIPRKWNARSMSRVATALKRQRKVATKILQITGGVPKRAARGGTRHAMVGTDTG